MSTVSDEESSPFSFDLQPLLVVVSILGATLLLACLVNCLCNRCKRRKSAEAYDDDNNEELEAGEDSPNKIEEGEDKARMSRRDLMTDNIET